MNKGDYNSEKLEAYIRNELSAGERAEFEETLRQDPLLQNELILQQDIIATIREHRKNELKQRLNRIDVNGTSSGVGGFQIGGALLTGLAVIGITGLLVFNYFGNENKDLPITAAVIQQPVLSEINDEDTSALPSEASAETDAETVHSSETISTVSKENTAAKRPARRIVAVKKKPEVAPVLPSDNFAQETFKEENIKKEDVVVMADDKVAHSTESIDNRLVIVDNTNLAYNKHYKYSNEQLFLYGFTKPYKILDVKMSRQRYLHYDDAFYKLDRNQYQIAPVQKVTNAELIKELEKLKEEMK